MAAAKGPIVACDCDGGLMGGEWMCDVWLMLFVAAAAR